MKNPIQSNPIQFVLFCLITLASFKSQAQCPYSVTVGSNVGISTLGQAVANSLITINSGTIANQDFCIDGYFEVTTSNLTFNTCNIYMEDNSTFFFDLVSGIEFDNCQIYGSSSKNAELIFYGSEYILIGNSNISDLGLVHFDDALEISDIISSYLTNISLLKVNCFDNCIFHIHQSHIDNCQGELSNYVNFRMDESEVNNVNGTVFKMYDDGVFIGQDNEYTDVNRVLLVDDTNPLSYYLIEEEGSIININGNGAAYDIKGATRVEILDNFIASSNGIGGSINIRNNLQGVVIEDNQIKMGAIRLINNLYSHQINRNEITNFLSISGSTNGTVSDNQFNWNNTTGTLFIRGIQQALSGNFLIENNSTSNYPQRGYFEASCDENTVSYNLFEDSPLNSLVQNSIYLDMHCNVADAGTEGFVFEGTNSNLLFRGNTSLYNTTGLVYRPSTMNPSQIEAGNLFYVSQGNLGALFEGNPTQNDIYNARFEVQNTALEFPPHSPSGWFLAIAATSYECEETGGGEFSEFNFLSSENENLIEFVKEAINCSTSCTDGWCYIRMKQCLQLIERYPELLNESEISEFYTANNNLFINQAPTFFEIANEISSIYGKIPYFNHNQPLADIEVGWPEFVLLLQDSLETLRLELTDYIESEKVELSNIDVSCTMEESYSWLMNIYLDFYLYGFTLLNEQDSGLCSAIASACIVDYGPAVYLAQVLCNILDVEFTEKDENECNVEQELFSLKSNNNSNTSESERIWPNPVMDILNLPTDGNYIIFNLLGKVIWQGQSNNYQMDMSSFTPGVYYIFNPDQNITYKVMKY